MNIHYLSEEIGSFYSTNRVKWNQFYNSEKIIFEKIFSQSDSIKTILDVGCACGGLGQALNERFGILNYAGIDINKSAIEHAKTIHDSFPFKSNFLCGDILESNESIDNNKYDLVTSLSCADWNTETKKILEKCWSLTADNGYFIFSFRLTNQKSLSNISEGFQYVHFGNVSTLKGNEEIAPYVVTNINEVFKILNSFIPKPLKTFAFGYWGSPSELAVIPYDKIVHSVFAIQKSKNQNIISTLAEIILPIDIFI